jgi:1-acyl-sn-glycerol-3-phosphate acyltransferase
MTRAHPWMPVSPCGEGCLPPAGAVPTVGGVRRLLRLLGVAAMLAGRRGAGGRAPVAWPSEPGVRVAGVVSGVAQDVSNQLTVTGGDRFGPPGAGVLVVSNQVSWLDLVALGAVQPLRMVAKSEVRAWPVIGPLARRAGTVFVDRERLSTLLRTVAAVSGALAGGAAIGAFPEGTTWCGLASGRFRPAVFQAAVDTATSVRPVALRYRLTGAGTTTVVSFVGSRSAGDRSTRSGGGGAPAAPAAADGSDRRALAAGAQAAVTAATLPLARPVPQLVAAAPALRAA